MDQPVATSRSGGWAKCTPNALGSKVPFESRGTNGEDSGAVLDVLEKAPAVEGDRHFSAFPVSLCPVVLFCSMLGQADPATGSCLQ